MMASRITPATYCPICFFYFTLTKPYDPVRLDLPFCAHTNIACYVKVIIISNYFGHKFYCEKRYMFSCFMHVFNIGFILPSIRTVKAAITDKCDHILLIIGK